MINCKNQNISNLKNWKWKWLPTCKELVLFIALKVITKTWRTMVEIYQETKPLQQQDFQTNKSPVYTKFNAQTQ